MFETFPVVIVVNVYTQIGIFLMSITIDRFDLLFFYGFPGHVIFVKSLLDARTTKIAYLHKMPAAL